MCMYPPNPPLHFKLTWWDLIHHREAWPPGCHGYHMTRDGDDISLHPSNGEHPQEPLAGSHGDPAIANGNGYDRLLAGQRGGPVLVRVPRTEVHTLQLAARGRGQRMRIIRS